MTGFANALKDRGFKALNPRGSEFRANRLFKREGDNTITIEVDLRKACRINSVDHLPNASVAVFETRYFKRRGRRNYDTTHYIHGGNHHSSDDRDFWLEYEAFGDAEADRLLQMVDAAIVYTERMIAHDAEEARLVAERFERIKPENWVEMTRHERFMWEHEYMMANMSERAALRKEILAGELPEGWETWAEREQNSWVGDRIQERLAAKLA